jgi:hypothetical protein
MLVGTCPDAPFSVLSPSYNCVLSPCYISVSRAVKHGKHEMYRLRAWGSRCTMMCLCNGHKQKLRQLSLTLRFPLGQQDIRGPGPSQRWPICTAKMKAPAEGVQVLATDYSWGTKAANWLKSGIQSRQLSNMSSGQSAPVPAHCSALTNICE